MITTVKTSHNIPPIVSISKKPIQKPVSTAVKTSHNSSSIASANSAEKILDRLEDLPFPIEKKEEVSKILKSTGWNKKPLQQLGIRTDTHNLAKIFIIFDDICKFQSLAKIKSFKSDVNFNSLLKFLLKFEQYKFIQFLLAPACSANEEVWSSIVSYVQQKDNALIKDLHKALYYQHSEKLLQVAFEHGNSELIEYLMHHLAKINFNTEVWKKAVELANYDIIKVLLKDGRCRPTWEDARLFLERGNILHFQLIAPKLGVLRDGDISTLLPLLKKYDVTHYLKHTFTTRSMTAKDIVQLVVHGQEKLLVTVSPDLSKLSLEDIYLIGRLVLQNPDISSTQWLKERLTANSRALDAAILKDDAELLRFLLQLNPTPYVSFIVDGTEKIVNLVNEILYNCICCGRVQCAEALIDDPGFFNLLIDKNIVAKARENPALECVTKKLEHAYAVKKTYIELLASEQNVTST